MAIIETKTKESIIKNGYLLETLSRERIWDEIKKSFSQSKDFNEYLKYILDFKLSQYIFPGVKINTKQVLSKNFIILIANLFLDNSTDKLEVKLVQDFKIDGETAKKVVFLLELLNLTPEVVLDTYRKKTSCSIDDSTILEWLEVTGNESNTLIKFLEYRPTVSSQDLMDQGFKGRDLGIKIKELEIEKFKNML
jgi:tRNA nucleotidyltransferase/poly(A) polymerase